MKILFLTGNGINDLSFGGSQASYRNYESLLRYGEVVLYQIKKKSNFKSLLSLLQGNFPPILLSDEKKIMKLIYDEQIDVVFLDGSSFGKIAKRIGKKNVPMAAFFHNCEYDYIDVRFGETDSLKKKIYKFIIKKEENTVAKISNYRMVFTNRDKNRIENLYHVRVDDVIPIGLNDSLKQEERSNQKGEYCLLFGAAGRANVEAFEWFIKNVSPSLNCKTLVAGKGFDKFIEGWSSKKVEVRGYMDDLSKMYQSALCVAVPLFSGGGMKIKVSEALMHGKYIFGTDEAFVGYEERLDKRIARLCRSKEEFIEGINEYTKQKVEFIQYAREVYEKNYSVEAGYEKIKVMLERLIDR